MKAPFRMTLAPIVIGTLLAACSGSNDGKGVAPSEVSPGAGAASAPKVPTASAPAAKDPRVVEWQKVIRKTPPPKDGCFRTSYPSTTWTELPCEPALVGTVSTPPLPRVKAEARKSEAQSRRGGGGGDLPGQGGTPNDWFLHESGPITQATGSFPSVQGATSAVGPSGTPNSYSIQLNTDAFTMGAAGDPYLGIACANHTCQVWQQAIYSTTNSRVGLYLEYWVLNNASACQYLQGNAGWNAGSSSSQCFVNSSNVPNVPIVPITDLSSMEVTLVAGSSDVLTMTIEGNAYSASFVSEVGLNQGSWNQVEYGVFGDLGLSGVTLSALNTTIVTEIDTEPSTNTASCTQSVPGGATGEYNNLTDPSGEPPGTCCLALGGATSGITFVESDVYDQACTVCGNEGQTCCSTVAKGWCNSPFDVCSSGTCTPCGQTGEACCAGSSCTPGDTCTPLGFCETGTLALDSNDSPLQVVAGGEGSANVIMAGPWVATDHGQNATGQVLSQPSGGLIATLGTGISIDGAGAVPITVSAPLSAAGNYQASISVTDAYTQTTLTATIPIQVLACVPHTASQVCQDGLCGSIPDGCGGSVSCPSCSSGSWCSDSHCCANGDFYSTEFDNCIPDSCPSGTSYCPALEGACATATACANVGSTGKGGGKCKPGTCS